jgi:hypothetical protein
MGTLEALAASPGWVLVVVVVGTFGRPLLACLVVIYQERAHTRRIEAAVRNTRSEHRGGIVRACVALRNQASDKA